MSTNLGQGEADALALSSFGLPLSLLTFHTQRIVLLRHAQYGWEHTWHGHCAEKGSSVVV